MLIQLLALTLLAAQAAPGAGFEVASVKPNTDTVLIMSGVTTQPGGRLTAKAATLRQLIASAYGVRLREVSGGPAWLTTELFDIEARAAGDTEPARLREMLQPLLAERFRLELRRETRTVPAYALTVAKDGVRAKPSKTDPCAADRQACPGVITLVGRIMGRHNTMAQLASALSVATDRPVVDRTGLPGFFELRLDWVPDETQYADWGPGTFKRPVSDPSGPALFTAVQEQLGLRLEPTQTSVDVIVVAAASRPTAN